MYGSVSLPDGGKIRDLEGVRVHGPVPRGRVLAAFRRADLLVFPTLCDGFGLVVAEAMAQGLPVLTTREAGAADLIEHGKNGFLVEPGSVTKLGEQLVKILEVRKDLKEMRKSCQVTALSNSAARYQQHLKDQVRICLKK